MTRRPRDLTIDLRCRPARGAPTELLPLLLASALGVGGCGEPCPSTDAPADTALTPGSAFSPASLPATLPFDLDALAPDVYPVTRGHVGFACAPEDDPSTRRCALDIRALRWDPASQHYTRSRSAPHVTSPALDDDVMWGMPIASPIDGEVIACWRRMPDDDLDGDDSNCPGGAETCTAAGNHLVILDRTTKLVAIIAHLQAESIPAELCPIDDIYLYTSDPKVCDLGPGWSGWRDLARLDRRGIAPIPVRRGERIGRVGSSGSGVGVHLHIHASAYAVDSEGNPCEGDFTTFSFSDSSFQWRSPGVEPRSDGWAPLVDQALPINGDDLLLLPDADIDRGCSP